MNGKHAPEGCTKVMVANDVRVFSCVWERLPAKRQRKRPKKYLSTQNTFSDVGEGGEREREREGWEKWNLLSTQTFKSHIYLFSVVVSICFLLYFVSVAFARASASAINAAAAAVEQFLLFSSEPWKILLSVFHVFGICRFFLWPYRNSI